MILGPRPPAYISSVIYSWFRGSLHSIGVLRVVACTDSSLYITNTFPSASSYRNDTTTFTINTHSSRIDPIYLQLPTKLPVALGIKCYAAFPIGRATRRPSLLRRRPYGVLAIFSLLKISALSPSTGSTIASGSKNIVHRADIQTPILSAAHFSS